MRQVPRPHHNHHTSFHLKRCLLFVTFCVEDSMLAAEGAAHVTGAARRRRERRLRAYHRGQKIAKLNLIQNELIFAN